MVETRRDKSRTDLQVIYAFGDFEVDLKYRQLRRGSETIDLQPGVFDLLVYLIDRRGRLVTKRELMESLWHGVLVTDAVLHTSMSAVRRAIGQKRGDRQPIKTEHGRGYCFTSQVRVYEGQAAERHAAALAARRGDPFIGRRAVMYRLYEAASQARMARGRAAVLLGDIGAGKSRVAQELADYALQWDMTVWTGRCWPLSRAPALWPWIEIARVAFKEAPEAPRDALLSGVPRDLGRLLLGTEERPRSDPSPSEPNIDFRDAELLDTFANFFLKKAQDKARMLILEDLQWSDAVSAELFYYLVSRIEERRLLVIATLRDHEIGPDHPADKSLQALFRLRHCDRISLGGLEPAEVGDYIAAFTGSKASPALIQSVWNTTGGNPLLVRESLRALSEKYGPKLDSPEIDRRVEITETARNLVRRRLVKLEPELTSLLGAAAAIGEQFDLPILETVTCIDLQRLLELLDRTIAAAMIKKSIDSVGGYAFTSPLVREVIHADLPSLQSADLHRKIGEALEARSGLSWNPQLEQLAMHFLQALPGGPLEKAVDYALRAGKEAASAGQFERAASLFRRALEALNFGPYRGDEDLTRAEALLGLGSALRNSSRLDEAKRVLKNLVEWASRHQHPQLLAWSALELRDCDPESARPSTQLVKLLEQAYAALPAAEEELRTRLLDAVNSGGARTKG